MVIYRLSHLLLEDFDGLPNKIQQVALLEKNKWKKLPQETLKKLLLCSDINKELLVRITNWSRYDYFDPFFGDKFFKKYEFMQCLIQNKNTDLDYLQELLRKSWLLHNTKIEIRNIIKERKEIRN